VFIITRSEAMRMKLRSYVEAEASALNLEPADKPVTIIHTEKEEKK